MNVLSLFGGIETGLIALKELGVKIDNYYSSEIDKYASSVARFNHPEIKELGSVTNYKSWDLPKIDLILAGPPCQGFSVAGKGLDWNDPRSQLFFTAIEILWEYKPKYFLFENVASMKKDIVKEIDELMEVDSVKINSALVSAQNRKRNYWCNWDVGQPVDKEILLKDIIESEGIGVLKDHGKWKEKNDKSNCIDANYYKGVDNHAQRTQIVFTDKSQTIPATIYKENAKSMVKRGKKGLVVLVGKINSSQDGLIVSEQGKAPTLTAGHGNCPKVGKLVSINEINKGEIRNTKNYIQYDISGKGHSSQDQRAFYLDSKHGTLPAHGTETKVKVLLDKENLIYRKLTPTECERLQTLPDNTTLEGINEKGELVKISNTQRYKMIGNGWTKDVIKHILSGAL